VGDLLALAPAPLVPTRSAALTIGIDVTPLQIAGGRHGTGSYLRALIGALARRDAGPEFVLFAQPRADTGLGPLPHRFRVIALPGPPLGRGRALLSHQVALPLMARRLGLHALHVPGVSLNPSMPGIPLWQPLPLVVTVHDLNPLHFPRETLPRRRHRIFYRAMLRAAARAAHIMCDSDYTARDVIARLDVPPGRITVAPLAPDPLFTATPEPAEARPIDALAPGDYVLHLGGPLPLKNLRRLLEAMAALWSARTVSTALACVTPMRFDPLALCPAATPYRDRLHVLESVPPSHLRWLYRHALCLAVPSLHEGFGLPVLEAMASGCPVIASDRASLPEVGGDAALYVDPSSMASIRDGLRDLIQDPGRRAALREAGLCRARRFSCEATAEATLAVYERVAREAAGSPAEARSAGRRP
jgi:glycosyltransferase involved in cell wall biosynthesis